MKRYNYYIVATKELKNIKSGYYAPIDNLYQYNLVETTQNYDVLFGKPLIPIEAFQKLEKFKLPGYYDAFEEVFKYLLEEMEVSPDDNIYIDLEKCFFQARCYSELHNNIDSWWEKHQEFLEEHLLATRVLNTVSVQPAEKYFLVPQFTLPRYYAWREDDEGGIVAGYTIARTNGGYVLTEINHDGAPTGAIIVIGDIHKIEVDRFCPPFPAECARHIFHYLVSVADYLIKNDLSVPNGSWVRIAKYKKLPLWK